MRSIYKLRQQLSAKQTSPPFNEFSAKPVKVLVELNSLYQESKNSVTASGHLANSFRFPLMEKRFCYAKPFRLPLYLPAVQ